MQNFHDINCFKMFFFTLPLPFRSPWNFSLQSLPTRVENIVGASVPRISVVLNECLKSLHVPSQEPTRDHRALPYHIQQQAILSCLPAQFERLQEAMTKYIPW